MNLIEGEGLIVWPKKHNLIFVVTAVLLLTGCSENPISGNENLKSLETTFDGGVGGNYAGVTPGGSQDMGFIRSTIESGGIPDTSNFTYEGLFSEHDFPLDAAACDQLVCADYAQAEYSPRGGEERRRLIQLIMTSSVEIATFHHRPTSFVVVFDRSGSMTGDKFTVTCNTLTQLVNFLDDGDQFGLISFNHQFTTDWELSPLAGNRDSINTVINHLAAGGSTDIESALVAGFTILENSGDGSELDRRILLFTDALPNTGNTAENDFLTLAQTYADQGIGITAFGVGLDFGVELATAISEIRGGNYVFLRNNQAIEELVNEDFEFLITPVAYDFSLAVNPGPGYQLANVYGLPGAPEGEFSLQAATLFLSRSKGALGLEFSGNGTGNIAGLSLSYTGADGSGQYVQNIDVENISLETGASGIGYDQPGAQKLAVLVEMIAIMKQAIKLHQIGYGTSGRELLISMAEKIAVVASELEDNSLLDERDLVLQLADNLDG